MANDYINDEPFEKVLFDRSVAILSAMLLYMKNFKLDKWSFKKVIPIQARGADPAKKIPFAVERWEIEIKVRKVG